MSFTTLLKPKGVYWRDLSDAEKEEVRLQIENIERDPSYSYYRFYRTQYNKWIICNAMTVPMNSKTTLW
jgi:hypothetical protein